MECMKCKKEMRLDDVDFNFKGNKDNYWICDKCKTHCIEVIRFGKVSKLDWCDEEGVEI